MNFDEKTDALLAELEELKEIGRFPNIPREVAEMMYQRIVDNNLREIFEVGACNGYSTMWLSLAAQATGGHVTTTEWGKDKFGWLMDNIKKSGFNNITALHQDARVALEEFEKPLDFVFIDAMAKLYLTYFQLIEEKLNSGAIVMADNVTSHKDKLQDFIDYVTMNTTYEVTLHEIGGGILEIKKK